MGFFLTNLSFIFIVEVSDPSRFSSNLLTRIGVFPDDAKFVGNITLPYLSQIALADRTSFNASEERVALAKDLLLPKGAGSLDNSPDDLVLTDDLSTAALRLLPELVPLRLQSVGTNFRVFVPNAPLDTFTQRLPETSRALTVEFFDQYSDVQTNFTMTASISAEVPALQGVLIDVNFNGQLTPESLESNEARGKRIESLVIRQAEFFTSMKGTISGLTF